jgi:hypothetical protein
MWWYIRIMPARLKALGKRIMVWGQSWLKWETLSEKYVKQKRAGGMTQVVEHLYRRSKALSSHPSTTKKQEHKKNEVPIHSICWCTLKTCQVKESGHKKPHIEWIHF